MFVHTVVFIKKVEDGAEGIHGAVVMIETTLHIEVVFDMLVQKDQAHGVGVEAAEAV